MPPGIGRRAAWLRASMYVFPVHDYFWDIAWVLGRRGLDVSGQLFRRCFAEESPWARKITSLKFCRGLKSPVLCQRYTACLATLACMLARPILREPNAVRAAFQLDVWNILKDCFFHRAEMDIFPDILCFEDRLHLRVSCLWYFFSLKRGDWQRSAW